MAIFVGVIELKGISVGVISCRGFPHDVVKKIASYAKEKNKNVWAKWYDRLAGFCDKRFGPNWRDQDREFWDSIIKY